MSANFIDQVRRQGIVGSGGAGFPAYAKLKQPVDLFIVNGAECEPLLHKDKELMKAFGDEILSGMARIRDHLGASEAVLGIKEKYHDVIDALQAKLPEKIRIHPLGDFYPAGDEFVLVYEVTGKVIPRGGLPLHVGIVVMNVETVLDVALDRPVTHKYLTVGGAVHDPKTVRAPIGASIREVIDACGGANVAPYAVLSGGVMMGKLVRNIDDPITKTTGGLLVFPDDHPLIAKYRRTYTEVNLIGKSACDQCSFCTELCPRYLLGHPIEPHLAMRALGFSHEKMSLVVGTHFCCECNLCSLIACPEDLDPKNVCVQNKQELRAQKIMYPEDAPVRPPHGMLDGRRTPVSRLIVKLGLKHFENRGPLVSISLNPERVVILLKQHVGAPATAVVKMGDRVQEGDVIATVPENQLGVPLHASMAGMVNDVTDAFVEIRRE
jgi:Na+-translocating ferredoxin:NAD+ oxidoreductase RnfC subunit